MSYVLLPANLASLATVLLQSFHTWRSSIAYLMWYISWNYFCLFWSYHLSHIFAISTFVSVLQEIWLDTLVTDPAYQLSFSYCVGCWGLGKDEGLTGSPSKTELCKAYINIRFCSSSAVLCLLVGDICSWGHCWSVCLYRQESGK